MMQIHRSRRVARPQTVREVIDWYDRHEILDGSPVAYKERRRIRRLFRKRFGSLTLRKARPGDLLDFIAIHKGVKSNHTRRRWKAAINRPFNAAAELELITRNPFRRLKIPDGPCGRDWTDEEYRAILRASHPYFRRLIVFLRFGGARPGEARTVTWPEVQDDVEAIVMREHKTAHQTHEPRRIHFNHVLLRLLIWLRRNKTHDTYVFSNGFGRPWTIQALTKHLRMIRRRAGLSPDVKLHGGRHTFTTHGIMNNVDIATMAELLGHRSLETTRRYLHLVNKKSHLNAAMNRAIGRPVTT